MPETRSRGQEVRKEGPREVQGQERKDKHESPAAMMLDRCGYSTPVLLPGKSCGQGSLVGCSPWGREESDTTERLHFHFSLSCIGEGNGNPLQCSCLENPRDGGAWWAAISGVAQSRTWLKRFSSSSRENTRMLQAGRKSTYGKDEPGLRKDRGRRRGQGIGMEMGQEAGRRKAGGTFQVETKQVQDTAPKPLNTWSLFFLTYNASPVEICVILLGPKGFPNPTNQQH